MKKFLFNKLSLKEYNMLASAPFELTTETEKAVLVKFTTEKGTKSIWIPKSVCFNPYSNGSSFFIRS